MKPIIGVVGHPYLNKDNNYIFEATNSIIKKISKRGGIPIIICPTQIEDYLKKQLCDIKLLNVDEKEDLNEILNMCDGIVKPGALRIYNYERYIYEYTLEKDMPYIGICAGMQLMTKQKNIKNDSNINHCVNTHYAHKVKILKETLLYEILKKDEILVNSLHNYHIQNEGINKINAYAEDGIIEGIENPYKTFHLGLQWHPEGLEDVNSNKIFDAFIDNSNIYKKKIKK